MRSRCPRDEAKTWTLLSSSSGSPFQQTLLEADSSNTPEHPPMPSAGKRPAKNFGAFSKVACRMTQGSGIAKGRLAMIIHLHSLCSEEMQCISCAKTPGVKQHLDLHPFPTKPGGHKAVPSAERFQESLEVLCKRHVLVEASEHQPGHANGREALEGMLHWFEYF